jgi:hypothetical protein
VTDITYIRTWEGWSYLAIVMDLFFRKIGGWSTRATIHRQDQYRSSERKRIRMRLVTYPLSRANYIDYIEVFMRHMASLSRQMWLDTCKLLWGEFHSLSISNTNFSVNTPYFDACLI